MYVYLIPLIIMLLLLFSLLLLSNYIEYNDFHHNHRIDFIPECQYICQNVICFQQFENQVYLDYM